MLQNARVTAFTISELLRENQQGGKITPRTTQIRVKKYISPLVFINLKYMLYLLIY